MKDLGPLSYFLDIVITRHTCELFICQQKYAEEFVKKAGMTSCKPTPTPTDTKAKLSASS